ncbi:phage associated protein [Bifidobacterium tissieri]|uniref:Phage associated protein n=1 Tax=Bifidobacterium tissieri TaxID=1630162 RepID=A0A261FFK4_9BIFI|nr:DUF6093 family protein [Bifidobacterium tissieri]OZG57858.1 phage associated protein [Bifidobacterium tissieri]
MNGFTPPRLDRLRRWAESLMTDRWRITRYTGSTTIDPETGASAPSVETVWEGPGRLQTTGGIASDRVSATGETGNVGGNVAEWPLVLHLPMTAIGVREKDLAECVESMDPELVGHRVRLVNRQSEKTHATARRWNVQEIPKGGD